MNRERERDIQKQESRQKGRNQETDSERGRSEKKVTERNQRKRQEIYRLKTKNRRKSFGSCIQDMATERFPGRK